jgi:hypothetical protein
MEDALRKQVDLEASEELFANSKKLRAEYEREQAERSAREAEADAAQLIKDAARERQIQEKERREWQAKERIVCEQKIVDYICRRIAGGEMLKAICTEKTMPTFQLVQEWFDDPNCEFFHVAYLRAVSLRDRAFEDEIVMIADDGSNDYVDKLNTKTGDTFRVLDPEALTRSKMRIDTRLRILKANNPARWGDNPNAGAAAAELLKNMKPNISFTFVEAPKSFVQGDDARVIEHTPQESLAMPRQELDAHDLEYIRRRDVMKKGKVA